MNSYTFQWKQTRHERYETDVNDRCEKVLLGLGMYVVGRDGGCLMDPSQTLPAEEFFLVECATPAQLAAARVALSVILEHPETLMIEAEDSIGVNVA